MVKIIMFTLRYYSDIGHFKVVHSKLHLPIGPDKQKLYTSVMPEGEKHWGCQWYMVGIICPSRLK